MGNQKKKKNILIPILLVGIVLCLCVTVWALFFREEEPANLVPDHAPPEESQAQTIPGDTGEKLDNPENGGSVSLTYAKEVTVDLSEGTVDLLFANPGKSNMDMVLQILIQDTVISQSGTLQPGKQILLMDLLEGSAEKLSVGVYEGLFNVLLYRPETGEKAIVNTEIPVMITVNP